MGSIARGYDHTDIDYIVDVCPPGGRTLFMSSERGELK